MVPTGVNSFIVLVKLVAAVLVGPGVVVLVVLDDVMPTLPGVVVLMEFDIVVPAGACVAVLVVLGAEVPAGPGVVVLVVLGAVVPAGLGVAVLVVLGAEVPAGACVVVLVKLVVLGAVVPAKAGVGTVVALLVVCADVSAVEEVTLEQPASGILELAVPGIMISSVSWVAPKMLNIHQVISELLSCEESKLVMNGKQKKILSGSSKICAYPVYSVISVSIFRGMTVSGF